MPANKHFSATVYTLLTPASTPTNAKGPPALLGYFCIRGTYRTSERPGMEEVSKGTSTPSKPTHGNTAMRRLVEPKGTSRSCWGAPQAPAAMGEGGGAAVMLDPRR